MRVKEGLSVGGMELKKEEREERDMIGDRIKRYDR